MTCADVYYLRFDTEQASKPLCRQEGVFRFNCMDCLDRTNVIQSVVAKEIIQSAVSISLFPFSIIPYLIQCLDFITHTLLISLHPVAEAGCDTI